MQHAILAFARTLILLLLATLSLTGCGTSLVLTYPEVIRTAVAQGCWSSDAPTPYPATVTPLGGSPTSAATRVINPGAATATATATTTPAPTTTPLPRCTPQPGETQRPWPTPPPTQPPFPTQPVGFRQPIADSQVVMRLPNAVLGLDVAAHPTEGWPVVAALDIPVLNDGKPRVFVRAYRPAAETWGTAQSVDVSDTHPGERFRSVAVGVAGDGTIHVVWGVTAFPHLELFAASSTDYGETWTEPTSLGTGYFGVLDLAVTLEGEVFALAMQRDPEVAPVLLHRGLDGAWSEREVLPLRSVWYASSGGLAVAGEGRDAHLVALLTATTEQAGTAYFLRRPVSGGAWEVARRSIESGGTLTGVRAISYAYRDSAGVVRPGVTFTLSVLEGAAVYALTSLDGGASWSQGEAVAQGGPRLTAAGVAYDAAAQSLVAVWNCCADAGWGGNAAATHYAAWSPAGSGAWSPAPNAADRTPLVSGARSAALTTLAQAFNARIVWLAWVEDGQEVRARSFGLNQVVPADRYPQPTARSTQGATP
jgi:hypothetical protein